MRLGSIHDLQSKQLKLAILAFSMPFLLWKWEEGTFHDPGIYQTANSKFVDQQTSSEENLPNAYPYPQSVVNVDNMIGSVDMEDENEVPPPEKKECNYRNGKWVSDNHRPLYSGFGCKQWLSESWSCRLTQRADFAPEFEGSKFLRRMQDKTIAYVGDSLGRQMFQSILCMVTGGKHMPDVEDVGAEYGFASAPGAKRPDGWAYRFLRTNTTIVYHLSSTFCDLEALNPSSDPETGYYAMHLDRPAAFLKNNLHRFHVLILNTGDHWNEWNLKANKWEMYVNGAPNSNRDDIPDISKARNFTIHSVVKWFDAQVTHRHPQLKVFFRSMSPRHFLNGDWNTGGRCDGTNPLAKSSSVRSNCSEDGEAESAVRGTTRIRLLDVTALSRLREEGHVSRYRINGTQGVQDCLHWCLPGVPDTWNEILAAQL